jgi:hypothetical protein
MNKIKLTGIAFIFSECVVKSVKSLPYRVGLIDCTNKTLAAVHMLSHEFGSRCARLDILWAWGRQHSTTGHVQVPGTLASRFYPMPTFRAKQPHRPRPLGRFLLMCHRISGSCIAQTVRLSVNVEDQANVKSIQKVIVSKRRQRGKATHPISRTTSALDNVSPATPQKSPRQKRR